MPLTVEHESYITITKYIILNGSLHFSLTTITTLDKCFWCQFMAGC